MGVGWAIMLPTLAALYVINKKANPRKRGMVTFVAVLTMVVAAAAGVGVAYTFLGDWTAGLIGWAGSMGGHWFSLGLGVALVVLFAGIAILDIAFDREADKGAQFAAIIMPTLLLLVVGGAMGGHGGDAVRQAKTQLMAVVQTAGQK